MDADDTGAWAFGGGSTNGEGVPYRHADKDSLVEGKDKGSPGAWKNGTGMGIRNGGIKLRAPIERRYVVSSIPWLTTSNNDNGRYYAQTPSHLYPPEVHDYNARFTRSLEAIKKRHDPTVATVAQGVLEWQRARGVKLGSGVGAAGGGVAGMKNGGEVQAWLDRFYMSRIGIRFLIGQRE